MHAQGLFLAGIAAALTSASPTVRQSSNYAGYLISTFTDAKPQIQQYLSDGNSASAFTFLNGGEPILASDVGTKGVRDIFLATNDARSEFHLIATGELPKNHSILMHETRVVADEFLSCRARSRHQRRWLQLGRCHKERKPWHRRVELYRPRELVCSLIENVSNSHVALESKIPWLSLL